MLTPCWRARPQALRHSIMHQATRSQTHPVVRSAALTSMPGAARSTSTTPGWLWLHACAQGVGAAHLGLGTLICIMATVVGGQPRAYTHTAQPRGTHEQVSSCARTHTHACQHAHMHAHPMQRTRAPSAAAAFPTGRLHLGPRQRPAAQTPRPHDPPSKPRALVFWQGEGVGGRQACSGCVLDGHGRRGRWRRKGWGLT